jgi:hypothetical protein
MKDLRVLKMRDLEKIQKNLHFVWGLMAYEYMEEEKVEDFRKNGWIGFMFDFETEEKYVLISGGFSKVEVIQAMKSGNVWMKSDLRIASESTLDDYIEFEEKSRKYGMPIL